jgi:hypothetical protein
MQCDNPTAVFDGNAVDEDDGIPVVVSSRWRLADTVARNYGLQAFLVDCGDPDKEFPTAPRWTIVVQSDCKHWSVPWIIENPRRFHDGLTALYTLLEQMFPSGKTLGELLVSHGDLEPGPLGPTSSGTK